jgi:hypothetical protein
MNLLPYENIPTYEKMVWLTGGLVAGPNASRSNPIR